MGHWGPALPSASCIGPPLGFLLPCFSRFAATPSASPPSQQERAEFQPIVYIVKACATSFPPPSHQTWKTLHGPPGVTIPLASPKFPWRHQKGQRHNPLSLAHGGAVPLRERLTFASCETRALMPARAATAPWRRRRTASVNTAATTEACGDGAVAMGGGDGAVAMVADRPADGRLAPSSPSPPSPPPIVMTMGPTASTGDDGGQLLTEGWR